MLAWIDRAAVALFDATVSTSLFLTFTVLIMLCCRQPAHRILIARVAILASLAMMPLVAFAPLPRLDLVEAVLQPHWSPAHWLVQSALSHPDDSATAPRSTVASSLVNDPFLVTSVHGRPWFTRTVALLAFAGMAIGVTWLALGFWCVRSLVQHSRRPSDPTLQIYHDLTTAAGHGFPPNLRVSNQIPHPSIFGIARPVIFIPARYEHGGGVSSEAIRLSLLHEIAHADRADSWFSAAASLAQSIWFFVPQIWWVRAQLLIDQEFLADRTAALAYGTSTNYASSLITLAAGSSVTTGAPAATSTRPPSLSIDASESAPSVLFQRVLMLLHCPYLVESDVSRSWTWLVRSTLIFACVLTACLYVRWPDLSHDFMGQPLTHHSSHHDFRVAHIIARPQLTSREGRSLPFDLPLALPPTFEISVELRASGAEISRIRIAGVPLAAPGNIGGPSATLTHDSDHWYQVHLVRTETTIHLTVDGRDVPVDSPARPSSQWLTIEPAPDVSAELRELRVIW